MIISDFMDLFVDSYFQKIRIYDLKSEKNVFEGFYGDNDEYDDYEIASIDNLEGENNIITINIEN